MELNDYYIAVPLKWNPLLQALFDNGVFWLDHKVRKQNRRTNLNVY